MRRQNLAVAGVFLLLGLYLVLSAWQLPAGMGRLPGPGFFPAGIGGATLVLAGLLLVGSWHRTGAAGGTLANRRDLGLTVVLIVLYLLAWGWIPFAARSVIFVVVFLRLLGQGWRASATVAVVLTAAVVLAFQYGLRVNLN